MLGTESLVIVLIILLVIIFLTRKDLLAKVLPEKKAEEPAPVSAPSPTPAPAVVETPIVERVAMRRPQGPKSEVDAALKKTQRNMLTGDYEIEDRAQLEQAEFYGYADHEAASTPGDIGDVYAFNPDDIGQVLGQSEVGPAPQDYTQAIKRIGLEPGVIENHSLWVQDQMKFSNAYATKTSGRNQATDDLFEGAVPFRGLRRPQAVPIYGLRAEVDDTPKGRIYGNKKFVFTY